MERAMLEAKIRKLAGSMIRNMRRIEACLITSPQNAQSLARLIEEQLDLQKLILLALATYVGDDADLLARYEQGVFDIRLAELLVRNGILP